MLTMAAICKVKYVSKDQLDGFDHYKYSCRDTSPVSNYITHPFWNQVVKLCPRWLAPNVLTFVGFVLQVLAVTIISYYDFDFTVSGSPSATAWDGLTSPGAGAGPGEGVRAAGGTNSSPPSQDTDSQGYQHTIPGWVWLLCAIFYFLAHTLDGIDGKQARRTNSSTPLGELFDHGLDSWATLFIPLPIYSIFGRGPEFGQPPISVYFMLWAVMFTFIMSHWEKYLTGVLYLPWGYDISQIGLVIIYLVTFLSGIDTWHFIVPGISFSASTLIELGIYVGTVVSLCASVYNIYVSYVDHSGKLLGVYEGSRPILPCSLLFITVTVWALHSPNNILELQPRIFYIMVGTIFSNITCRLIISQMSQTRADIFNLLLIPALLASLLCVSLSREQLGVGAETSILYSLTALALVAHIHYGVAVVQQLAEKFDILVFSLAKRKDD